MNGYMHEHRTNISVDLWAVNAVTTKVSTALISGYCFFDPENTFCDY